VTFLAQRPPTRNLLSIVAVVIVAGPPARSCDSPAAGRFDVFRESLD